MASVHIQRIQALMRWLERHHHLISNGEADALGISRSARQRLHQSGIIVPTLPGVWIAGNASRTPELDLRIALKAAPAGSAASGWSAAWWLGLHERPPPRPEISVDVARRLRWDTVTIHRTSLAGDTRFVRDLRVTTPERTLLDLAASPTTDGPRLTTAVDRAITDRLTTVERIARRAQRRAGPRIRGGPRLRAALAMRGDLDVPAASVLEHHTGRLLAELRRQHGIDAPSAEVEVCDGRFRLDCAWPRLHLAVEVDGYAWHSTDAARQRDRRRRNELVAAGWAVLVFSWQEVVNDPAGFCEQVLAAYLQAEVA